MKQSKSFLLAPMAVAAAFTAQAQEAPSPFYLKAEAGAAFQQGLKIKGGDKIDFDTGFRGDLGAGWQFSQSLAAELETGVIYNKVNSIGSLPVSSYGGSANFYQVPLLANLVYTLPLKGPVHPYIGAGVGGVVSLMDLSTPLGNVNDADCVFGYQALAGVQYDLSERVALGVGYKFLGTTDHHWSQHGVTLDTDPTLSHSVLATLTWRF